MSVRAAHRAGARAPPVPTRETPIGAVVCALHQQSEIMAIVNPVAWPAPRAPSREGGFVDGTDEPGRFAWIHKPMDPNGVGLVIVPPFGYEAICAHRSLRHLAEAAARAGVLAVRFDLDGTGDSIGDDLEPARLEAWLATIGDACDLVRTAGATRLVLAGVRLGATLATLVAEMRGDVAGLVAIAAVPCGKALVREGRALQLALDLAPPPADASPPDAAHEIAGFALTDETRAAITDLDLTSPRRPPARAVLVIDRDDRPPNDAWVAAMRGVGADVIHDRLPGYLEMMLDPHRTEVPRQIIDTTVEFAASRPPLARVTRAPAVVLAPRAAIDGLTEELVAIDDHLVGIASWRGPAPRRAVILLNAGATPRIGPNRLYVKLARVLAARGMLAVRIDQSGLGDSPPHPGADENVVYAEHAVADVGATVAWVRARGATHVTVVGMCSGAYHALRAGVAGHAIDAFVSINPLTFFWKPDLPLDFAAFRVTADARRYQQSMRRAGAWRKLLRGDVDLARVARVVGERARAAAGSRARDVLRHLHVRLPDDLGGELRELARRDVAMHFVFAADDPGREMLLEQGGSVIAKLVRAGTLSIDVIPNADHTFTARWSHPLLIQTIVRALA